MRIPHHLFVCGADQRIELIRAVSWATLECLLFTLAKTKGDVSVAAQWSGVPPACNSRILAAETSCGEACGWTNPDCLTGDTDAGSDAAGQAAGQRRASSTGTVTAGETPLESSQHRESSRRKVGRRTPGPGIRNHIAAEHLKEFSGVDDAVDEGVLSVFRLQSDHGGNFSLTFRSAA